MCFTCEHLWHVVPALIVILETPWNGVDVFLTEVRLFGQKQSG